MFKSFTNMGTSNILTTNSTGQAFTRKSVAGTIPISDWEIWTQFKSSPTYLVNKANKYLDLDAKCNVRVSSSSTTFSNWTLANGIFLFFVSFFFWKIYYRFLINLSSCLLYRK